MKYVILAVVAATIGSAALTAPQSAQLAGRWTQASKGSELVLVPKFKLQPNVGVTAGTSLGGSVGYGSMTRTTIVTDPVPLLVNRSMTLDIAADGQFSWVIVKAHPETPGGACIKTTRIERKGRAVRTGNQIRFGIQGGTESWEKSCGGSGSAAVGAASEAYTVTLAAAQMRLVSGSMVWSFRRS